MYDIFPLSEYLYCLGGLIHDQSGVSLCDLFDQDLYRVLRLHDLLLKHFFLLLWICYMQQVVLLQ